MDSKDLHPGLIGGKHRVHNQPKKELITMKSNTQNQAAERNFLLYRLDVAQRRPPGDYKTAVIAGIEHSLRFLEGGQRSALHPAPSNYLRNATLPTMPSESAAPVLRHGRSRMSTI